MHQKLLFQTEYQKKDIKLKLIAFFAKIIIPNSIFLFCGHVGAGKTFLIKKLLNRLFGLQDIISPTYTYVKNYSVADLCKIIHFDLYRLKSPEDFLSLGFWEELTSPRSIVIIEWPEIIIPLLEELVKEKNIYLVLLAANPAHQQKNRWLEVYKMEKE